MSFLLLDHVVDQAPAVTPAMELRDALAPELDPTAASAVARQPVTPTAAAGLFGHYTDPAIDPKALTGALARAQLDAVSEDPAKLSTLGDGAFEWLLEHVPFEERIRLRGLADVRELDPSRRLRLFAEGHKAQLAHEMIDRVRRVRGATTAAPASTR